MSLKKIAFSGLFWSFFQLFGLQGLNFVMSIVMARMLSPQDYGVLGMLAVFMAVGWNLVNGGMTSSLIRSSSVKDVDYSTVFWLNLLISLVLYLMLAAVAPLISKFFDQEILIPIIRVYCLTLVFSALSMVQKARLSKKMDFKTQMLVTIPSSVIGGIIGISMAYYGFGVWALVWMYLAQSIFNSAFFWFHSNWQPKFEIKNDLIKYHFNFGYKLTLAGILESVFRNSYQIVIGKIFPVAELGFYTKADNLKQLPVQSISSAIDSVTFPLFSKIQDDDQRLKNAYKVIMQQILFWLAPILTFSGILAVPIFRFLMTEKWVPAAPYFQILCIIGIIYPLQAYNINILKVKGRTDLILYLEIFKKVPLVLGLAVAFFQDIYFLLYLQVGLTLFYFIVNSSYSGKMIGYTTLNQIKDLLPIFGLVAISGIALTYLIEIMPVMGDFQLILIGFSFGLLLYLALSYLFKIEPILFLKQEILKR